MVDCYEHHVFHLITFQRLDPVPALRQNPPQLGPTESQLMDNVHTEV
jgi:hypothetical protein